MHTDNCAPMFIVIDAVGVVGNREMTNVKERCY